MIYWYLFNIIIGTMLLMIVYYNVMILGIYRPFFNPFNFVMGIFNIIFSCYMIVSKIPG
jgi:hypothetical protein